jgi:hypothetical protein
MQWFIYLLVIWLSFDIVIVATAWYASVVIAPRYPTWWKRVIVDIEPDYSEVGEGAASETEAEGIWVDNASLPGVKPALGKVFSRKSYH